MELPDRTLSWAGWREMLQARRDTLGAYLNWRERGEAIALRTGPLRHCVFYTPQAVGQVLKQHSSQFVRSPLIMRVFSQWNGQSVLIQEGKPWLRTRRMLAPAFQPQRVSRYSSSMVDVVEQMCAAMPSRIEVSPMTVALTLRILSATIFGLDLQGTDLDALRETIRELGEIGLVELFLPFPVPLWLPIPFARRKKRAIGILKRFVEGLIEERSHGERGGDLLSDLLAARDDEGRLTPQQVRDEAMTLMLAGHDTTAAGMGWLLYLLACHPEVAERVAQGDLAYTEQVVKESLRLYPPAPSVFLRQALEDVEIAGYRVPRGALVHLPSFVIQRDARYFPNPERFDPERFAPEQIKTRPEFAWFPFGGGPRVCLGQAFALLEMTLATATLMKNYRLSLPSGPPPQMKLRLALWPPPGMTLTWERR